MFLSTVTQGHGRRRAGRTNKGPRASQISLLSSFTTNSSNSSGSTSTITQASFSQYHSRKGVGGSFKRSSREAGPESCYKSTDNMESLPDEIDVFAFLETNRPPVTVSRKNSRSTISTPSTQLATISRQKHISTKSSQSNVLSGIDERPGHNQIIASARGDRTSNESSASLRISPPPYDQCATQDLSNNGTDFRLSGESLRKSQHSVTNRDLTTPVLPDQRLHFPPDARSLGGPLLNDPHTHSLNNQHEAILGHSSLSERPSDESPPPPLLCRTFRRLQHRILLQLQDELLQMEHELTKLDRADKLLQAREVQMPLEFARHDSWGWHRPELQARRLDLLGMISSKLEQYSLFRSMRVWNGFPLTILPGRAIKLTQDSSAIRSPDPSDIACYRDWLKEQNLVSTEEMRFLDDSPDLMQLYPPPQLPSHQRNGLDIRLSFLGVLSTCFVLMYFKLVTGILSRLICIFLVYGFQGAIVQRVDPTIIPRQRESILTFAGVMAFLAVVY